LPGSLTKKANAQDIKNRLPSEQITIKVLTSAPAKSEMSKWNDPTMGIDFTNNFVYFKFKNKFKKAALTDY